MSRSCLLQCVNPKPQLLEALLKASLDTVSRRLDDMLFTLFDLHIISYELLRRLAIPNVYHVRWIKQHLRSFDALSTNDDPRYRQ